MVLEALEAEGGTDYLREQAQQNPVAFMGLLSKILPSQLQAEVTHTHKIVEINMIGLDQPKQIEAKQPITLGLEQKAEAV